MSDNLKIFPSSKLEALTTLYLENTDITGLSPSELLKLYHEVHNEIQLTNRDKAETNEFRQRVINLDK